MFPTGKLPLLKAWKVEILQGKIEKILKLQRSLEMLARREMENLDFSFAQECSNDRVLHTTQPLLL